MSLLPRIRETLDAAGIPYAMIGALALAAHGVNRASVDIDLLTVDLSCLKPDLWSDLESQGIKVQVRKGDLTDPLAGVVRFGAPGETPVDVVVGKFRWQRKILERAEPVDQMPFVRAADLILLKLYAGGPQDAWDIQQLLEVPQRTALIQEVEGNLADLPVACRAFWRKILQAV
jgi:hypothetical protein